MNPIIALSAGLGASVIMNFVAVNAWLSARDDAADARRTASQQSATAAQCSAGVADIELKAKQRAEQAEAVRDAAIRMAGQAQKKALELVSKQPTVPGDDCASARVQVDEWLSNRSAR